jgi:hypothetical protein
MSEVSLVRLYVLRAMYLLIVLGMGLQVWPAVLHHEQPWELMQGVVNCMLAAFAAVSLLGLRYPLQMLPILLWELVWKVTWLAVVALPQWRAGTLDEATSENMFMCSFVILVVIAIPWRYACQRYLRAPGERWTRGAA